MSATGYGQVQRRFWTHHRYQDGLTLEDKALVSYLLTGPHSNGIGAYRLPLAYAADDLRVSVQTVRKLLTNCIRTGFCRYCEQSSVVWIPKAMRYQDVRNGNVAMGRGREFDAIPKSCAYRPEIAKDLLENGKHWSEQLANSLETISKQAATPEPEPEPEPERESSYELSCAEPRSDSTPELRVEPPVVTFLLIAKDGEHGITQSDVDRWTETYPAIDVMAQLRRLREWCISNPKKRKTKSGAAAFITGWLDRAQNDPKKHKDSKALNGQGRPLTDRERALAKLDALDEQDARNAEHPIPPTGAPHVRLIR